MSIDLNQFEGFTPGPWEVLPQSGAGPMIVHRFDTGNQMNPTGLRLISHMLERRDSLSMDMENAALIAAAPALLAYARELEAENARLRGALERAASMNVTAWKRWGGDESGEWEDDEDLVAVRDIARAALAPRDENGLTIAEAAEREG